MKLSVALSNDETGVDPRSIVAQARLAEELGYAGVWVPDHLLPPEPYGDVYGGVYEALMLLSHVAAVTTRVTLGTTVIIVPLREPVLLAKQLATLERLAPGRVVFGVGVGWDASEFDAVGVPFSERGARTDETIDLIHALHRGEGPPENRFFGSGAGVFEPRPSAPVPVMVGGMTGPAFRRAARVADRWQAFGLTPQEFRTKRGELDRMAAPRRIAAGIMLSRESSQESVAELLVRLRAYDAAGADEVTIHFGPSAQTSAPMTEVMERWRSDHQL
ncbi:TIGR03619 family F420-dependent LLM class oxidoreductase [Mycolicibacterium sp. P1-18]|uniref:TIGR03619 family F420-dependent LLM class oxidoreductase n=1 Tax=Mycolicibacterium sp. P1-18 TaxID=2024615 RepID=UPI0011F3930E|nr:TIGR03619 family F420-dependent LLM class oxidoreductase [Mycolicibacterium sp. P1-18]KAA0097973.1 TIGR03619 family F420-dependent LLM class oxidoreductase [Mycolicibacterium sp. P1-18]